MNTIQPGFGIQGVGSLFEEQAKQNTAEASGFGSIFSGLVQEVEQIQAERAEMNYNLAIGDIDDLGEVMASAERAQASVQMLIQLRNKLLDSYSEIMRMSV